MASSIHSPSSQMNISQVMKEMTSVSKNVGNSGLLRISNESKQPRPLVLLRYGTTIFLLVLSACGTILMIAYILLLILHPKTQTG